MAITCGELAVANSFNAAHKDLRRMPGSLREGVREDMGRPREKVTEGYAPRRHIPRSSSLEHTSLEDL